jgi:hypothetical protein
MDRCILCLKSAKLVASLNDIDILQFFQFTSSVLVNKIDFLSR